MVKVHFVRDDNETITVEVPATCGGCCACATCHIHVNSVWYDKVKIEENSLEQELLEYENGYIKNESRLACQIQLDDSLNGLTVKLRKDELL
jgi:ferredoxin, 2Fe-2S